MRRILKIILKDYDNIVRRSWEDLVDTLEQHATQTRRIHIEDHESAPAIVRMTSFPTALRRFANHDKNATKPTIDFGADSATSDTKMPESPCGTNKNNGGPLYDVVCAVRITVFLNTTSIWISRPSASNTPFAIYDTPVRWA